MTTSPKNAQITHLNTFFGPKVCFFIIYLILSYFILTCYHPPRCSITRHLAPPPAPHNWQHNLTPQQPRHRAAEASKGWVSYPFFVLGMFSPPLNLFHPTNHTYGCSCVCSTDCFLFLFYFLGSLIACTSNRTGVPHFSLTPSRPTPRNGPSHHQPSPHTQPAPQKTPK